MEAVSRGDFVAVAHLTLWLGTVPGSFAMPEVGRGRKTTRQWTTAVLGGSSQDL